MTGYSHLSYWERHEIARFRVAGWSLARIAAAIGRGKWTISREPGRNSNKDSSCNPASADRRYMARRQRPALLDQCRGLARYVVERLQENWTPGQIAGWLKQGHERGLRSLCHEAIYGWIYSRGQRLEKHWKLASPAQGETRLQGGAKGAQYHPGQTPDPSTASGSR